MPVLNGTNHDEERIFVSIGLTVSQGTNVPIPETPVAPGNYQANIAAALGVTAACAAQIAAEYPPGNDQASATVAFSALAGDASFACPALRIDEQTSQRVPAYAYEFKRRHRAAELHRPDLPTARGDTSPNSSACSACPTQRQGRNVRGAHRRVRPGFHPHDPARARK